MWAGVGGRSGPTVPPDEAGCTQRAETKRRIGVAGCSTPRRDYRAVTPTLARRARRVHQRGGTPRCPLTVRHAHRDPSGIATHMGRDGTARRRASGVEHGPAASQETASLYCLDVPRQCRQDPSEALLPIMEKQDHGGSHPKSCEAMPCPPTPTASCV